MEDKKQEILAVFKPFLWSYDISRIDLKKDKKRIITNVLNIGTKEALDLLFKFYSSDEIKEAVANPLKGEWNEKSINYWTIIFDLDKSKLKYALRNIG